MLVASAIANQRFEVNHSPALASGAAQERSSAGREATLVDATARTGPGDGTQKLGPTAFTIHAFTLQRWRMYRIHLERDSSTISVASNRMKISLFKTAVGRVCWSEMECYTCAEICRGSLIIFELEPR